MLTFLIRTSNWPNRQIKDQSYLQHFNLALLNLEINNEEERFKRKPNGRPRKK
ncbi:MAG TPA: hypothetical protein PKC24_11850 [Cyclobacteriaceae bacterium]|nr:hypothetical protein [Cyclobacteriaceae bacterium]